jgi:hypothetical protein
MSKHQRPVDLCPRQGHNAATIEPGYRLVRFRYNVAAKATKDQWKERRQHG